MSPVQHPVSGRSLTFSLADEMRAVRAELAGGHERSGRTLVKEGALRLTLVGLVAGGTIQPHKTDGPISVHVLDGEIVFEADGTPHTLGTGSLFVLDAGVLHTVRSPRGGIFLLTVVSPAAERG